MNLLRPKINRLAINKTIIALRLYNLYITLILGVKMAAPRNTTATIFSAVRGKYSGEKVSSVLDKMEKLKPETLVEVLQGFSESEPIESGLEMLFKIVAQNPKTFDQVSQILNKVPPGEYNIPISRFPLQELIKNKVKNLEIFVVKIQELTNHDIIGDYVKAYQKKTKVHLASDVNIKHIFEDMYFRASPTCRDKISTIAEKNNIRFEKREPVVVSREVDHLDTTPSLFVEDKKNNPNPERKFSVTDFPPVETKEPIVSTELDSLDTTASAPVEDKKGNFSPERKLSLMGPPDPKTSFITVERISLKPYRPFFESLTGYSRQEKKRLDDLKQLLVKLDSTNLTQVLTGQYKTSQIEVRVENRADTIKLERNGFGTLIREKGQYRISTRSGLSILLSNLPDTDIVLSSLSKILRTRSPIPVDNESYLDFTKNKIVHICNNTDLTSYLPTLINIIKCDLLINNKSLPLILLDNYLSKIKLNSTFNETAKNNLIELIKRFMAIDAELKPTNLTEAQKTAKYPGYQQVIEQLERFKNNTHFNDIYKEAGDQYQRELKLEIKSPEGPAITRGISVSASNDPTEPEPLSLDELKGMPTRHRR